MCQLEDLCRLLDERGVEWAETISGNVRWIDPNGDDVVVLKSSDGYLLVKAWMTPQQAIDATLGRGECHMQTLSLDGLWLCDKCGYVNAGFALSPELSTSPSYCPQCGARVVRQVDHGEI